jgi:NADH-quinone oxidoreductase subunit C
MTREELQAQLTQLCQTATFDEGGEWLNATVPVEEWKALANTLKKQQELAFDYLFCLTCVDWKSHLTMVYHMTSTTHRHHLVIKIKTDRTSPEVPTVSDIWRTADFHEREVFELFGVNFTGHPDLRKLILPDDWEGFPLRKDYEDPVNMIKL